MSMKEAYQKKLQAQSDEWSAEIDELEAKADKAEADAQLEYYKQIKELRSMQEAANSKLAELKEASDNAWEDLKAGMDSAWNSLGNALNPIISRRQKMKKINYSILMLIAILAITLTYCADSSKDKKAIKEDKTSKKEVKQEAQDLIQALEAYTADQRDEAVQKGQTALDNLGERIDALEKSIEDNWDQMDKTAREKARANLEALRKQRSEVAEWYDNMKTSSADTWDHTKKGFSDAYKALEDAWEKSAKEFGANK